MTHPITLWFAEGLPGKLLDWRALRRDARGEPSVLVWVTHSGRGRLTLGLAAQGTAFACVWVRSPKSLASLALFEFKDALETLSRESGGMGYHTITGASRWLADQWDGHVIPIPETLTFPL